MINFVDVDGLGTNVLTIKGGHNILFQGSNDVDICDMRETLVDINVNLKCHGTTEFIGDCTIPNHYNKTQVDAIINSIPSMNNVYTKTEVDDKLVLKLDNSTYVSSIVNYYTKTEVNNLNKHITNTSKINFMDVDSTGETILKIIGDNTSFKTSSDVALFDMSNTIIESKKNMKVNGTLEVTGDCTLHNVYTKFEINGFLAAKRAISNSYSTNDVDGFLSGKQNTIADGGLTIAKTNGLQTALDGKQNTIADGDLTIAKTAGLQTALDNAGSEITVTANRALISDGDGKVAVSDITNTELAQLDGINTNSTIQTQLNGKIHESQVYTTTEIDNKLSWLSPQGNITTTELEYLNNLTGNIQTQLNNKPNESQVYTTTEVDNLILNIGTSFYYLLRYDYEGDLFHYIKDPKFGETPDEEVDTNLYNIGTNIREWVLLLHYSKSQDLVQLQTLYNNANRLVKNYNDNTLFTFLATFDKYFLNWFYRTTLRNSDLFGTTYTTNLVNSFLSYVNPIQNATILNLSPQLNRYFPLSNDLKDYTDTYTFPSNTVFAGIDEDTMSYKCSHTQGDLLIDLTNDVSNTSGKVIKHGYTTECWIKFLLTQTTDSDFLKLGYANAINQTSNGNQAVLSVRKDNSTVYIKLTDGGNSIQINKADNPKFNIDRWMHLRVFIQDKKWFIMIFQDNKMFVSTGLLTTCYGIHDLNITANDVNGCSYLIRDLCVSNGREYETGDDYYSTQKRLYWLHSVISPRTGVNLEYVDAFLFITPANTIYTFNGNQTTAAWDNANTTVVGAVISITIPTYWTFELDIKKGAPTLSNEYHFLIANTGNNGRGVNFNSYSTFNTITTQTGNADLGINSSWTGWASFKLVRDSSGFKMYFNGVLKSTLANSTITGEPFGNIYMASYLGGSVGSGTQMRNIKFYAS